MRVAGVIGAVILVAVALMGYGYISLHHGDTMAYQSFFAFAVAPVLSSLAVLFATGRVKDQAAIIQKQTNVIQKQTNGITAAHQDIIQSTLPALTQEVTDIKNVIQAVIKEYPQVATIVAKEAPRMNNMIERKFDQWL